EAAIALAQFKDLPVLTTALNQRVIYAESAAQGLAVIEAAPNSEAAREMGNLAKQILVEKERKSKWARSPQRSKCQCRASTPCSCKPSSPLTRAALPCRARSMSPNIHLARSWTNGCGTGEQPIQARPRPASHLISREHIIPKQPSADLIRFGYRLSKKTTR